MGLPRDLLLLFSLATSIALAFTDEGHSKRDDGNVENIENEDHLSADQNFTVPSPAILKDFINLINMEMEARRKPQSKEAKILRKCQRFSNTTRAKGFRLFLDKRFIFGLNAESEEADSVALEHHQLEMNDALIEEQLVDTATAITRYWASLFKVTDPVVLGYVATKLITHMAKHPCPRFQFFFPKNVEWTLCDCSEELLPGDEWRRGKDEARAYRDRNILNPAHEKCWEFYDRRARKLTRCNRFFATQFIHMMLIGAGGTESMRVLTEEHNDMHDISSFYDAAVQADKDGTTGVQKICLVDRATGGLKHAHWPAHRLFPLMELVKDALNGMKDIKGEKWTERFLASVEAQKNNRMVDNNNN